jgi:hypothetical protein
VPSQVIHVIQVIQIIQIIQIIQTRADKLAYQLWGRRGDRD